MVDCELLLLPLTVWPPPRRGGSAVAARATARRLYWRRRCGRFFGFLRSPRLVQVQMALMAKQAASTRKRPRKLSAGEMAGLLRPFGIRPCSI